MDLINILLGFFFKSFVFITFHNTSGPLGMASVRGNVSHNPEHYKVSQSRNYLMYLTICKLQVSVSVHA